MIADLDWILIGLAARPVLGFGEQRWADRHAGVPITGNVQLWPVGMSEVSSFDFAPNPKAAPIKKRSGLAMQHGHRREKIGQIVTNDLT